MQKRNLSSVHVDKLINKEREWTDVASRYLSTGSEPRPNCAPRVVTCITSHGDLEGTMKVFRNSTSLHSLPWWKKFCLMYVVLRPWCLPGVASSTKAFELQNFSQDSSKKQVLCTAVFQRNIKFRVYSTHKLVIFNFFLHDIVKILGILIKKKLSNFAWIVPILS